MLHHCLWVVCNLPFSSDRASDGTIGGTRVLQCDGLACSGTGLYCPLWSRSSPLFIVHDTQSNRAITLSLLCCLGLGYTSTLSSHSRHHKEQANGAQGSKFRFRLCQIAGDCCLIMSLCLGMLQCLFLFGGIERFCLLLWSVGTLMQIRAWDIMNFCLLQI
jgi:hypothetical protein